MPNREINPLEFLNLPRYVMQWWNGRKMDKYIGAELEKRFQDYQEKRISSNSTSVIDLVLKAYLAESEENRDNARRSKLDPRFRASALLRLRRYACFSSLAMTL